MSNVINPLNFSHYSDSDDLQHWVNIPASFCGRLCFKDSKRFAYTPNNFDGIITLGNSLEDNSIVIIHNSKLERISLY